jgi:hypothetical protein
MISSIRTEEFCLKPPYLVLKVKNTLILRQNSSELVLKAKFVHFGPYKCEATFRSGWLLAALLLQEVVVGELSMVPNFMCVILNRNLTRWVWHTDFDSQIAQRDEYKSSLRVARAGSVCTGTTPDGSIDMGSDCVTCVICVSSSVTQHSTVKDVIVPPSQTHNLPRICNRNHHHQDYRHEL